MIFYDKKGEILLIFYWSNYIYIVYRFNVRKDVRIFYIINERMIKML